MPWIFVQMYGRIQFSDIVVFQALEENNRALRLVGRADGDQAVTMVQTLAQSVRRLAASWELLRTSVPASVFAAADRRRADIERLLEPALGAEAVRRALHRLSQRAYRDRSRITAANLEDVLRRAHLLDDLCPSLMGLSIAFQVESAAWQTLPMPGTDESRILDGFERCYRQGHEIGDRRLEGQGDDTLAEWRRFAELTYFQLDSLRPALSDENRARRWCLGRLIDALCKHEGVLLLRRYSSDVVLDGDAQIRIDADLEASLDDCRSRALKLVPHAYGVTPPDFRDSVAVDLDRFAFEHNLPLPRTA